MADITIQEANIISLLRQLARANVDQSEIDIFLSKLKRRHAISLANKEIARGRQEAAQLTKPVTTQPLRIGKILNNPLAAINSIKNFKAEKEYKALAVEYRKLTGKHFKRNGYDMHNKHTKLQAIKIRIKQIQDRQDMKSVMEDIRKKNGPDFNLSGAL